MKLLVATDFTPNCLGGGPSIARHLLSGFRDSGNKIFWWSCRRPYPTGENFIVDQHFFAPIPKKLFPARRLTKFKSCLIRFLWAPLAGIHLKKTIRKVKPDCIWVIPHIWSILPLYSALVSDGRYKVRFHSSIHDFPNVLGNARLWGRSRTKELIAKQECLFTAANSRDAISIEMLDFLNKKKGGNEGYVFHDSLDINDFKFLQNNFFSPLNSILRIAFVGTIFAHKEFEIFIQCLKSACENNTNITLEFWSAHSYKNCKWFDAGWMIEHSHAPRDILRENLAKCDWGVITMPFDDESLPYSKYSFPTRFISYLAAGLPTIFFTRADSAVSRLAEKYNLGLKLHSLDVEANSKILKQELWNRNTKRNQREAILSCAKECFDAQTIRSQLWGCFADRQNC
jgi:hypothetical protein